ncbi:P-loop containing nucleoside triphosphate hydrolase protein [Cryomyces antarcticus]
MVQIQGKGWSDYVWADANGPWETDRLTSIITRETASRLGNRLTTLDYRHAAISIGRVFVGEQFGSGYREEVGEVEEAEVELEDALELHAGRGEKIGVQRYGVPSDIVKHLSIRSMETFRPLSEAWHRFLDLSSDEQDEERKRMQQSEPVRWDNKKRAREDPGMLCIRSAPPKLVKGDERGSAADQEVHKGVGTAEVETAMQRVLGRKEVSFRSKEQELAMEAILAGQTPLVVVLPTGGGKSLLFMVPACSEEPGVTIVVAPFRALVDDLVDRLKKRGIDCLEWKPGEVNPAAVVVVSADMVANWTFLNYASLLDRQGLLRRVVIDECHLTFTSSDYRPKLAQLKHYPRYVNPPYPGRGTVHFPC